MQDYKSKLKNPLWQKKRLEIMQRDGFKCVICNNHNSELHVHHSFYDRNIDNPWEYPDETMITICDNCHNDCHNSKIGEHSIYLLTIICKLIDKPHSFVEYLKTEINYKIEMLNMTEKEAIKLSLLELIKPA